MHTKGMRMTEEQLNGELVDIRPAGYVFGGALVGATGAFVLGKYSQYGLDGSPDPQGVRSAAGQLESSLESCIDPVDNAYRLGDELALLAYSEDGERARNVLETHEGVLYGLNTIVGDKQLSLDQCSAVSEMVGPALDDARGLVGHYENFQEPLSGMLTGGTIALLGVGLAMYGIKSMRAKE